MQIGIVTIFPIDRRALAPHTREGPSPLALAIGASPDLVPMRQDVLDRQPTAAVLVRKGSRGAESATIDGATHFRTF